jgi:hypothetical protein
MYKLIISCFLFVFASCSTSQTDIQWSSLSYMYESGPLPPKYQYNYTINMNTNGDGGVVCFIGSDPSSSSLIYEFKISKDSIAILDNAVKKSKILDEEIERLPEWKHPIGGYLEKVRVVIVNNNPNLDQAPQVKESPYFPIEKYKEGLQNLYKTIVAFVPQKIWDDFEVKKQEYQSKEQ